jgi:hypothetical protein
MKILSLAITFSIIFFCAPRSVIAVPIANTPVSDWAEASDPLYVKVTPGVSAFVTQNPPRFAWNRSSDGELTYEIVARHSTGKTYSWRVNRNWLLPSEAMLPGEYSWRVRPLQGHTRWSIERQFSLSSAANQFVVPDDEALISRIRTKPHPRSLPIGNGAESEWRAAVLATRQLQLLSLEQQVKKKLGRSEIRSEDVLFVSKATDPTAWAASLSTIRHAVESECRQLRSSALLWRITRNQDYFNEALKRAAGLIALDPYGSTSYQNQDQATRNIAWSLTLALDYLGDELPLINRKAWLNTIKIRTQVMRADIIGNGRRLEQMPFDSHGSANIGYLAAIASLLVGDLPEAEQWFRDSFRMYAQYISPWGGEEGGYAGGTAYAEYSADVYLQLWDPMHAATGVDFFSKSWSKGLMRFFVGFVPPGATLHVFGDAAESKPYVPLIKAYSTRIADPLAAWYVKNLIGEEDASTLLAAPIVLPTESVSPIAPKENAFYFPSIGWVAMHSELADRGRNSVYFKSSEFGSFNHSHGDQNSFVLVAGGKPLLIDSGYYDWYGSPHWLRWYRQTSAHNAITFDGGKGQIVEGESASMQAKGHIKQFTTGVDLDMAEGDATDAYGGALTKAIRRIWYLRDMNVLVVWDRLSSLQAHTYEWNMHAPAKFEQLSESHFKVSNENKVLCIDTLWPLKPQFSQTTGYLPAPQIKKIDPVWHARIESSNKQTEQDFVHVLRIGCQENGASALLHMKNGNLKIGKHSLFFK